MRIVADENVHADVIGALRDAGHLVYAVAQQAAGSPDWEILQSKQLRGALLLTYDSDFGELVLRRGLLPPTAIIFVRMPLLDARAIATHLLNVLASKDILGWFIVVEAHRTRRRPLLDTGDSNA